MVVCSEAGIPGQGNPIAADSLPPSGNNGIQVGIGTELPERLTDGASMWYGNEDPHAAL